MIRALSLILLPLAAAAETPMSGPAFDAATRGKTITYGAAGGPYGAEEYLDGRRVRWSFLDGECVTGTWYTSGPAICFDYEDYPTPQCWLFYDRPGGIAAEFLAEDGADSPIVALNETDEPLYCKGPRVGV